MAARTVYLISDPALVKVVKAANPQLDVVKMGLNHIQSVMAPTCTKSTMVYKATVSPKPKGSRRKPA